jgi:hypothetical protein
MLADLHLVTHTCIMPGGNLTEDFIAKVRVDKHRIGLGRLIPHGIAITVTQCDVVQVLECGPKRPGNHVIAAITIIDPIRFAQRQEQQSISLGHQSSPEEFSCCTTDPSQPSAMTLTDMKSLPTEVTIVVFYSLVSKVQTRRDDWCSVSIQVKIAVALTNRTLYDDHSVVEVHAAV